MAVFVWKGRNRYGDAVSGERVAGSRQELARILQKEQIAVSAVTAKKEPFKIPFLKREKIKLKDLAVYSRQLSVLIDAELPLIQSLSILAEQTKNKYFRKVIVSVREDVEAGSSLNQAKRKFPKAFDDLYCNLVASGEQSGSLDTMLQRLADYIEKTVKLKAQVKQAMVYPTAIVLFSILTAVFLMWKVIPVFASIFVELEAKLPFVTQAVVAMSDFLQSYILYLFLGTIAFVFLFRYFKKTKQGRRAVDRVVLRLPLFGKLLLKVAVSRVTRTLSTLITGGVSMLESLKITASTSGNVIIEKSIMDVRKQVSEGKSLTQGFQSTGRFPFMMSQMISVGEATGTLDQMLTKLADFYDDEVSASVAALLSVMEPMLLIGVGGIVGTLILSMYLPIFSLMSQIQ
ncbi:MAG: type II secretion system F family protein [Candidatus Aminicenantes bacterium]|nr:type II secretion system F family protein [Candidatus Aminicenantes bacterium]